MLQRTKNRTRLWSSVKGVSHSGVGSDDDDDGVQAAAKDLWKRTGYQKEIVPLPEGRQDPRALFRPCLVERMEKIFWFESHVFG